MYYIFKRRVYLTKIKKLENGWEGEVKNFYISPLDELNEFAYLKQILEGKYYFAKFLIILRFQITLFCII